VRKPVAANRDCPLRDAILRVLAKLKPIDVSAAACVAVMDVVVFHDPAIKVAVKVPEVVTALDVVVPPYQILVFSKSSGNLVESASEHLARLLATADRRVLHDDVML
jgi:hypothetical protein